jgi:hypothetical protein
MPPALAVDVVLAIVETVVDVEESGDRVRVRLFKVPVYDSTWEGVRRRKARRARRRKERSER